MIAMFGWIKGLGAVSRLAGLVSWFPATWPFAGAVSAVLGAVGAFISTVFNGLVKIVSNPMTLVASATVAVVAFGYGIKLGFDLDGRRAAAAVRACNVRVEQIETKLNRQVDEAVAEALSAEDSVPPLPDDISEACKRSASCRSRGKL